MLVLTREIDGVIEIQDRATGEVLGTVMLVDIRLRDRGRTARLGFEFPERYAIHRKEVADQIRRGTALTQAIKG